MSDKDEIYEFITVGLIHHKLSETVDFRVYDNGEVVKARMVRAMDGEPHYIVVEGSYAVGEIITPYVYHPKFMYIEDSDEGRDKGFDAYIEWNESILRSEAEKAEREFEERRQKRLLLEKMKANRETIKKYGTLNPSLSQLGVNL